MKTIVVLLSLLFTINAYSQGDLTLNLYFFDDSPSGHLSIIQYGLDSLATDSIDEDLGEWEWPPDFCGGWGSNICAGFMIPPSQNSTFCMRDFRFGISPYNLQANHLIHFQPVTNSMYIAWSLPNGTTGLLKDPLGGIVVNVTMADSNLYQVPSDVLSWCSYFFMTITYENVIPVELVSFNASLIDNKVNLYWSTATESNNSRFEILRLTQNDVEWSKIGFVPGFRTTTEPKSYSFIDEDVTTGIYKYRLKQIDFDGSFEYSNEIEVEVDFTPKEFVLYQNYPNPFNPSTTIKFSIPEASRIKINIYNSIGEAIENLADGSYEPGNYEIKWNAQNYPSGIYFYTFEANNSDGSQVHRETRKIVYLK